MGLKQSIIIKSQFGSKTPSRYIKEYTSRKHATESLEIKKYITQYTPRLNATEQLKQNVADEKETAIEDEKYTNKEGVLFGNHGLSYSEKMLDECARKIQKATDEGHVPIMQVISFEHEYLKEKGIIDENMEEPEKEGQYKGKVDQLKLRQGIQDMMNRMHRDMGFNEPEWGAAIHLDTKHVHVHITTVETGQAKPKRLKKIKEQLPERRPRMRWYTEDKTSYFTVSHNDSGFIEYKRNGKLVAEQEETKSGNPKWFKEKGDTGHFIEVERGKISQKVRDGMRDHLNRSLSKTKDIKPFVKEVGDKKRLTKALTLDTVYYNDRTVEKLKTLVAALPDNRKMWRAKSNAKAMERPHEIANDIIEDIWVRNRDAINLDAFEKAATLYAETRQYDEKFDDKKKNEFITNAFNQLKEESINQLYRDIKANIKEDDKHNELPKYSIKGASTEALKNEIVKPTKDEENRFSLFENMVHMEYKTRSYNQRYQEARYNRAYYEQEIQRYDYLAARNKTSDASKVVRNHYQHEYNYNQNIVDKYAYLKFGRSSGVSKARFEEVKGTDLVNMLYDYGKGDNRTVPKRIAEQYVEQTNTRKQAINETLDYLVETNQIEQYEILRQHRDSIRKESDIAEQIQEELAVPIPSQNGETTIEKRKTIDTVQGRRLLKQELRQLEAKNREVASTFHLDKENKRYTLKENKEKDRINNLADYQLKTQQEWAMQKMKYSHFYFDEQRKRNEEQALEQSNINTQSNKEYEIQL
ncbi:relaxase MobL [Staphylococcus simulans]|uniref:relaxase MobL n=1 Tax=Staphylococcus simulans TaxID=1286 RepID=UPI000D1F5D5E|nr:relaxase MobL [Staphylococcus simulans]PTJ36452.1 hypothetical protein BU024_10335 [Staphylococcus simulans]